MSSKETQKPTEKDEPTDDMKNFIEWKFGKENKPKSTEGKEPKGQEVITPKDIENYIKSKYK